MPILWSPNPRGVAMRLKTLWCILLTFTLVTTSCADPKTAMIKFSQELAPLEMSLYELNTWWNVYIARDKVGDYEVPVLIYRIEYYKNQLQGLNTKLMQLHAPGELAHVKQLFLEVYGKRLTYCALAIRYYSVRDEQAFIEGDRLIDEANQLHGEAYEQWMSVLEKYGISLEEIRAGLQAKKE